MTDTYFVTGATGVVGSAVVPRLIYLPDTEVRLLVRAESASALDRRRRELLAYWGWENDPAKTARLRFLRGDATEEGFGLDPPDFDDLAARCTHVIHCAGAVRMNLDLADARRSAVGSAREIIGLARLAAASGRLKKVDFVSTVGVAGKRPGTLEESWLQAMPEFHNTYEQAKAEAEVLVRKAVEDEKLPITVHRPSMVIGDSRDGRVIHFQIFYFLCEFLSGRRTLGLYPGFGETRLDIIPSDTVATAIVAAGRDPATRGRIFHLCSGPVLAPRLEDVKATVRRAYSRHGLFVPPGLTMPSAWYGRLAAAGAHLAPARHRKAMATLPIYLNYLADRQAFGNPRFADWFAALGHAIPRWQDYLDRILDRYLADKYRR